MIGPDRDRRDLLADAFVAFALAWVVLVVVGFVAANDARLFYDYRLPDPYRQTSYASSVGFYYSPPIAQALAPLTLLPWPFFAGAWIGASLMALRFLAGRWALLLVFLPPLFWELEAGNISLLLGLAIVAGFRRPWTWSFVLLTKVTPGVGLLWFAVRREFRALGMALFATGILVALSASVAPQLWAQWVGSLQGNAGYAPGYFAVTIVPLWARLVIAALVVSWGALTDRPWTVVVAATIATPVIWLNDLSTLVACLALLPVPGKELRPLVQPIVLAGRPVALPIDAGAATCTISRQTAYATAPSPVDH